MKEFSIHPTIKMLDSADEFCERYAIGKGDLVFVSGSTYQRYFEGKIDNAHVINYRKYGKGEPTDLMAEGIYKDIKDLDYKRVIAIGGGTILDLAKLFTLKNISPVTDLFEKKLDILREKELVLVPTTCGTGSEVTNVSILELTVRNTKFGLAADELFADEAVLIPQLLENLPFRFYATSSIDALIHAIESYTSPRATAFSKLFSKRAMEIILNTYKVIAKEGENARRKNLGDMLIASCYGGIAFGNAGTAAVHAMSYPLGAAYHVPHGEANYAMFTGVYEKYMEKNPHGSIKELNEFLAGILDCDPAQVYPEIDKLLNLIPQKPLSSYGMKKEDIESFTDVVLTKQGRLTRNNYVELTKEDYISIYTKLF